MPYRRCSRGLSTLIASLMLVATDGWSESQADLATDEAMDTLVTTDWLSQHLDDSDLVVLDCTVRVE